MGIRSPAAPAVLLALALLVASCGSGDVGSPAPVDVEETPKSQSSDGVTSTAVPTTEVPSPTEPVRTASYRGVSEYAIKVGIVFSVDLVQSFPA